MACSLCDRDSPTLLPLGALEARGCPICAWRLGRLLVETPDTLLLVWPLLADDDDGSPEPRVRLADGTSVELRQRTEELKRELSVEKRMALSEMYGELGLPREQLLEAGFVLSHEPPLELAQRALDVLFAPDRAAPHAVSLLRRFMLPS
jgi:hypothetical protein